MSTRVRRETYTLLLSVFENNWTFNPVLSREGGPASVFLELARNHGVSALLKSHFQSANLWNRLPPLLQNELESDARAITQQTIRNEELIGRLDDTFKKNEIPYCVLKGRPFELRCYGESMLRPSEDVDVLIPPEEWDHTIRALNEAGLRCLPHHAENFFVSDLHGAKLDLHTGFVSTLRVPSRGFVHQFDRGFWSRRDDVTLNGRKIPVPSSEETIIHLAIHTLVHHGGTRLLNWIDLDRALTRLEWDPTRLIEFAREQECEKILSAALTQVHRLLKTPLPNELIKRLTPPSRTTKILLRAASENTSAPEEIRFALTLLILPDLKSGILFIRETLFPSQRTLKSLETTKKSMGTHLRFKHWKETIHLAGQTLSLATRTLTRR